MNNADPDIIRKITQKNNLPTPKTIRQFNSGQINRVYEVDTYVVKLEGDLHYAKRLFSYQPEINALLFQKGAKVAKILDYGAIDDKEYLLMEKVPGKILSHYW